MWSSWSELFAARATRPLPDPTPGVEAIPATLRPVLARSLRRFQAGETGEGRIVHEVRRANLPGTDAYYADAVALFVAEEGRHARLLGLTARVLDGGTAAPAPGKAPSVWTERVFRTARRTLGVRTKLIVLWCAELVAIAGYGAVADALPPCGAVRVLRELIADEETHRGFHTAYFRVAFPDPIRRAVVTTALTAGTTAALAVLWLDHRELWQALGVTPAALRMRVKPLLVATVRELTVAGPLPLAHVG